MQLPLSGLRQADLSSAGFESMGMAGITSGIGIAVSAGGTIGNGESVGMSSPRKIVSASARNSSSYSADACATEARENSADAFGDGEAEAGFGIFEAFACFGAGSGFGGTV